MTHMGSIAPTTPPLLPLLLLLLVVVGSASALLRPTDAGKPVVDNAIVDLPEPGAEYRLPRTVHPEHYKLEVITHLNDADDGFRFSGRVWIRIACDEDTDRITLHSKQLKMNESSVYIRRISGDNQTANDATTSTLVKPQKMHYDDKRDFLHVDVTENDRLRRGSVYELFLAFEAPLQKALNGYYLSSYFDKTAQRDLYLSVTQFEATYARQAFPCFDEPAMKAKFEIILGHADKYQALSNMPIARSEPL